MSYNINIIVQIFYKLGIVGKIELMCYRTCMCIFFTIIIQKFVELTNIMDTRKQGVNTSLRTSKKCYISMLLLAKRGLGEGEDKLTCFENA